MAAATRVPGRAQPAARQPAERARQRGQRRVEGRHPAAVDRLGGGLDAERVGHGVGHRALQRMRGVEVALDRPALDDAQREPERVLARAVVVDAPRRARAGRRPPPGRAAATAPQARCPTPRPQAARISATRATCSGEPPCEAQAIARWRSSRPEALEHAGAHGRQRLQRLGRRAQEGLLVVVAVGQRARRSGARSRRARRVRRRRGPRLKRRPSAPRARRRRRPRRCRRCSRRRPAAPRGARRPRRCAPRRRW